MQKRTVFLLVLLYSIIWLPLTSQVKYYPYTNFTTKDYGREFHPSNMAIAMDQRGLIYAANGFKLLEFDGKKWNSYPINKEKWIISIAIDKTGIIYTGSQNEFGFFSPDKTGTWIYNSLSDSLKPEDMFFTNIWKVHAFSGGIVFQAEEKIFLYSGKKLTTIEPEESFHTSFVVNDILYVRERGKGLMQWNGKELIRIEGGDIFSQTGIFVMLPFGKDGNKILIGTREMGFWLYNPDVTSEKFSVFQTSNNDFIAKSAITGGVVSADGSVAISTSLNGAFLMNSDGIITAVFNKESGITDNDVKQVITDSSDDIWLALNNGISRVEISSPLTFYTEKAGLTGSINSLIRFNGRIYAGTSAGLFIAQDLPGKNLFFETAGLNVTVRSLVGSDKHLFIGTDAGIFTITASGIEKAGADDSFALFWSDKMKMMLSGGSKGLRFFRNEKEVKVKGISDVIQNDIIGISSGESFGNDSTEFWIGTRFDGVIRIRIGNDLSGSLSSFGTNDGLPGGPVYPWLINSQTLFGTIDGVYSFVNESAVKETLPDSLKNNKEFLKGYFKVSKSIPEEAGSSVSVIAEDETKIWISADNRAGYLDKRNDMKYTGTPFNGIDVGKINNIYPDINGITWFATTDGLIAFDNTKVKNYASDFSCLIRKVISIRTDSVLFNGTNSEASNGTLKIKINSSENTLKSLAYSNNSLRFDFSAPFFEYSGKNVYSYFLDGTDNKWSPWKEENFQEFTNLREGKYTFRVKARNVFGTESGESIYNFSVLPPWYRTTLAYIIYLAFAAILIWLIARLYAYRLQKENLRLEGIVTERTAEVVSQRDVIEKKNVVLELQKKEIEDSIRYAFRIQTAVIPSEKDCRAIIPECFVFFRPLNIVSGDFYWIGRVEDKIIFTAADCTGHGVPGAIMSMLGVAFLDEIVNKDNVTEPDVILGLLRNKIIQALQQQGISGESRDGMDIALVAIDKKKNIISYSGAYNPLVMIRNGEITVTAGDKMPVGIYEQMSPFTRHEIEIRKGDLFYMASDGYEDQFGGPEGKKLKAKNFRQMLLEIHTLPLNEQKNIIEKRFDEWKGDVQQIDDIVVTGFRIE